ncbi:MAG: hypothetical protein CMI60_04150 [Parvibaculum sp.]|nr:hypothetical protein [Parvibaculum sp.]
MHPTGRNLYAAKCHCRQVKMTMGTHCAMTVRQARTRARTIIAEAKIGHDPSAEHSRMRQPRRSRSSDGASSMVRPTRS